ncbi:ribonuclease H-like protein [Auricularia subglabra TFB-10046 SS5]|nr:ribonuclease H-like protein [Auricularia subglabra TFB-10046 SS5]
MRALVLGTSPSSSKAKADPRKYVALDCEMVGVGPEGAESSLARVSAVDYHGAVLLDVFVKQREHVADWRTHVSGVRESDMKHAKPFDEVQKAVAKLLEGRILVGHALSNDMQALLLSHPRPQTRDTQLYCGKLKLTGSRPSLRNLAKLHFGIDIQQGEHSSVIDARAAMAIYRVHSKAWEQVAKGHTPSAPTASASTTTTATLPAGEPSSTTPASTKKRKRDDAKDGIVLHLAGSDDEAGDVPRDSKRVKAVPAKKTKASAGKPLKAKTKTKISSGLSTIVRGGKGDKRSVTAGQSSGKKPSSAGGGDKWWTTLGGAKGSVRI